VSEISRGAPPHLSAVSAPIFNGRSCRLKKWGEASSFRALQIRGIRESFTLHDLKDCQTDECKDLLKTPRPRPPTPEIKKFLITRRTSCLGFG
jgi:hypothetical protein